MGLSASQARYLMLTAKQSDLQYQGQQINQERTVLSQQVSDLYNSLLSMEVPTPPATTDYQKIKYAGTVGTAQYSFYASSVKPTGTKTYTVTLGVTSYGHSLDSSTVNTVSNYGVLDDGTQVEIYEKDGEWYYEEDGDDVPYDGTENYRGVAGCRAYALTDGKGSWNKDLEEALGLDETTVANYIEGVKNSGLKNEQGESYTPDDFDIFVTGTGDDKTVKFVLHTDVEGANQAQTYSYVSNGSYTKTEEIKNCKLTFDSSTGRILTLEKPTYDEEGTLTGYTSISLSSSTETDEYGYQNAYAQYEYKKYLYDQEQQEINAKTSIIQQEDRNLELKLQRLDTENNEIKTELDAVKEVLKNNVETSYKTFSG